MNKITFKRIDNLIKKSEKPLDISYLEDFQEEFFGEFRHNYYRFLHHLVAATKPAIALEIGIDHGHGVISMAAAQPKLSIGIDHRPGCASYAYDKYNLSNCHIIYGDSTAQQTQEAIAYIVDKNGPIGVVFQDSSHHYNPSLREFEIYSHFLDKNAIWICDDVRKDFHDPKVDPPGKSMVEYFETLPGNKRLYEDLHFGTVIGIALL